jgi:predicted nucleic-acid-binding Zn-ribbon protein
MDTVAPCPNCGGEDLYYTADVSAGGGFAPNYLPGLGGFWGIPEFTVIVCADCGLARFFASEKAKARLSESRKWQKVDRARRLQC